MIINIVDLGIGNMNIIGKWITNCEFDINFVDTPEKYLGGPIIIPGVGSSSQLLTELRNAHFDHLLNDIRKDGEVILGICAGYQILTHSTNEDTFTKGLGLLDGKCEKFDSNTKGSTQWKRVEIDFNHPKETLDNQNAEKILNGPAYFNHNYAVYLDQEVKHFQIKDSVLGVQFHPESSGNFGQDFLKLAMERY